MDPGHQPVDGAAAVNSSTVFVTVSWHGVVIFFFQKNINKAWCFFSQPYSKHFILFIELYILKRLTSFDQLTLSTCPLPGEDRFRTGTGVGPIDQWRWVSVDARCEAKTPTATKGVDLLNHVLFLDNFWHNYEIRNTSMYSTCSHWIISLELFNSHRIHLLKNKTVCFSSFHFANRQTSASGGWERSPPAGEAPQAPWSRHRGG